MALDHQVIDVALIAGESAKKLSSAEKKLNSCLWLPLPQPAPSLIASSSDSSVASTDPSNGQLDARMDSPSAESDQIRTRSKKSRQEDDSDEWHPSGSESGGSSIASSSEDSRDNTDHSDMEQELQELIGADDNIEEYSVGPDDDDDDRIMEDRIEDAEQEAPADDDDEEMAWGAEDEPRERHRNLVEVEEDYYEHMSEIAAELRPDRSSSKPPSMGSVSTTYSEDIIRACTERERAEETLLDLAKNRPGDADSPEFPLWYNKLMTASKFIINWHNVTLPDETNRIKT
ncbi:hypothetical protein CALCODRAFT_485409, partial [Calocera cornea HHB12733]